VEFRGWPAEALEFFEGLEADNSKSYWHRNKGVYETAVRAPMEALIDELAPKWGDGRGRLHPPDLADLRCGRRDVGDGPGPARAVPAGRGR
jgi:uncharacterized protein (DUF2461 family)